MKRWNGWGEERKEYTLPESAKRFLVHLLGENKPVEDVSLQEAASTVPESRLKSIGVDSSLETILSLDPEVRLRHARGQSLPDWVALRSGHIGSFPDGVAYPRSSLDVQRLIRYAYERDICIIPYGGGTSVVGHINPLPSHQPTLTVDMAHLNGLEHLDQENRLATFGAGIAGPQIEGHLNQSGYTLGHFPQSFEYSTLGGWIATRSSGQQSYYYGRIENLFAGGSIQTPIGVLGIPLHPASAAGPDLRQVILGSEGRLGVITRATVRVRALPERERFFGAFFRDWHSGCMAVREIAQSKIGLSMMRLSDAQETETTLMLSGKENLVDWARRGLSLLGYGEQRSLLIYAVTGDRLQTGHSLRQANSMIRSHGGLPTGRSIGKMWKNSRFWTPYLRNTLWSKGYALDTLETAVPWSSVAETAHAILSSLRDSLLEQEERVLAFAHLSHIYDDGASIYITFLFRRAPDPEDTLQRWKTMKSAASRQILTHDGTISHQHGVGTDHAPYLPSEKGHLGIVMLNSIRESMDPKSLLNPGKLLL